MNAASKNRTAIYEVFVQFLEQKGSPIAGPGDTSKSPHTRTLGSSFAGIGSTVRGAMAVTGSSSFACINLQCRSPIYKPY